MKKLITTLAIVMSLSAGAMAQNDNHGGGLFGRGGGDAALREEPTAPLLPGSRNLPTDVDGEPLTDGVLLLAGLAGAYLLGKRRKE